MSFPRHWTRTASDSRGNPMEYVGPLELRVVFVGGSRPWRIANRRGMYARSWMGRMLCFSSPDAAAKKAEQSGGLTPDFMHTHRALAAHLDARICDQCETAREHEVHQSWEPKSSGR